MAKKIRNTLSRGVIALLLFASPVSSVRQAQAANDEYAHVHSVALISGLGNDIDMQTFGPTIFGNDDWTLHSDWNLDGQIIAEISKALDGRFEVKGVLDSKMFTDLDDGINSRAEMKRRILSLPKRWDIDAYVVVLPQRSDVGSMHRRGLTVSRFGGLLSDGQTIVGTYYEVGVFDAAIGDRIDYGTAQYPTSHTLTGHEPPSEECSNTIWAGSADKLTEEQAGRIRQEMSSLISRGIAYTLASANLIDKNQAAAATAASRIAGDASCHPML